MSAATTTTTKSSSGDLLAMALGSGMASNWTRGGKSIRDLEKEKPRQGFGAYKIRWHRWLAVLGRLRSPQLRALEGPAGAGRATCFSSPVFVDEVPDAPEDLIAAAQRTHAQLFSDDLGTLGSTVDDDDDAVLVVVQPIEVEARMPIGTRDEGYSLVVPTDRSHAVLKANSTIGCLELWLTVQGTIYTIGAPVEIQDSPAYPYRGFMLDTARNFFPVSDIERTLDAMSWVHINTFHWHVVDSQSFPLVVPGFTDIAEKAAYSADAVYTPHETLRISCPMLASGGSMFSLTYANEPPAGQLRLASRATIDFMASLLSAAAKLFPSTLFATGGDEINTRTLNEALDVFTQATHGALRSLGKTPVVWEGELDILRVYWWDSQVFFGFGTEMVLNFNLTLSNDTIALVWISSEDAAAVAAKGFRFIHAASNSFYLDCGAGGWVGNYPQATVGASPLRHGKTLRDIPFFRVRAHALINPFPLKAYTFDPMANLTSEQASLVLGGQHLLWTEQSGPENLDSIAWPRAAASARCSGRVPGKR
ncbi:glycoside hydrolase superfamily [Lactifluus volemus]|nr:glycoside hydrolase superfamily [Lactifluus volemus]